MKTGIITTIQRMSIHDGPGLRSTMFLKGCNLRCRWCHNPETWSRSRQLQHIGSRCVSCRTCIDVCVEDVFGYNGQSIVIDREKCTKCGRCAQACPAEALSLVGREISSEEAVEELLSDKIFYDTSEGGITISGGEPLMQAGFCMEVLKGCKEAGVHTAIESNMSFPWNLVSGLLPYVDLWMCDIKLMDSARHLQWTKSGNENILANIRELSSHDADIVLRTPVIPGFNDNDTDIRDICDFVNGLKSTVRYELLGFHSFGFDKFCQLGMPNPLDGFTDLGHDRLEHLKDIVKEYNLL